MAYRGRGKKKGGYKKPYKKKGPQQPQTVTRVKLPRDDEVLGLVSGIMGGSRMMVSCKDGKERLCRIPGRLKNKIWVREGDVVIIKPWEIEGDKKGDVVWRYRPLEAQWLKNKGYI